MGCLTFFNSSVSLDGCYSNSEMEKLDLDEKPVTSGCEDCVDNVWLNFCSRVYVIWTNDKKFLIILGHESI